MVRRVTVRPQLADPDRRSLADAVPENGPMSWWPAARLPDEPLSPAPGFACLTLAEVRLPTVAVLVFGVEAGALDGVVHMIALRQRRDRDFKPVFLTDSPVFSAFRNRGYAFEFLPREIYGRNPHLRRTPRAVARMNLLQQKWAFDSAIDLTQPIADDGERTPAPAPAETAAHTPDTSAPESLSLDDQVALVEQSGLFDEAWYIDRYAEVVDSGVDPIRHYLTVGAERGYDPSPVFQTAYYLQQMISRRDGDEP